MGKSSKHVVKSDSGWVVKDGGKVASKHRTQENAIDAGRKLAKKDKCELVVHGRDGKIRSKDSFGNDPNPPKDSEY